MKLNKLFRLILLVILFTASFLIGCGEDREMHCPDIDLPDSATVTVEVPAGAAFDLAVSGDFREEVDFSGLKSIVHNKEQNYSFTENFSQTFSLVDSSEVFPLVDPDERYFSVKLKCTALESKNDEETDSLRLIIKFNGDGNFERGNLNEMYLPQSANVATQDELIRDFGDDPKDWPGYFNLGTSINSQTVFSRYDCTSSGLKTEQE